MDIITLLNQIRKDKKIPIKDVAKALKLSNTQTYNILTGKSNMSVNQLETICNCIEIGLHLTYHK